MKDYQKKSYSPLIQQCLPNLKIRNQFIIIVAILVLLIVLLLCLCNLVHYMVLKSYYLKESNSLFEIQSQKRITQMQNLYRGYFEQIFALNGNALISFHRLYHQSRKQVMNENLQPNENFQMMFEGTVQIPDVVRSVNNYGTNVSNSFMCYSNTSSFSEPLSLDEKIGIKLQEQIQAYGQLIYQDSIIMQSNIYSYIDSQKINNIYPCVNRGKNIYNYQPLKRDWYLQLKKTYDETASYEEYIFQFTPPYQLFTFKTIGLSMTLPIVNEKLEFIGGVASTFLGAQLVQYLSNNSTGFQLIYLVSDNGTMIMHPFSLPVSQLPIYIYNETITGFNMTDWENILNPNSLSSCENYPQLKCRYNLKTQQMMIVSAQIISQYKMYLIMSLSSSEYVTFTETFQQNFQDNLLQTTIYQLLDTLIVFLILSFLIYVWTQFLFSPIEIIVSTTKQFMKSKKRIVLRISHLAQFIMSEQVYNLIRSCQYIFAMTSLTSKQKSDQCLEIEEFQYPIKNIRLFPFIQYQKNKISEKLQDFISDIQVINDFILKWVVKSLKNN